MTHREVLSVSDNRCKYYFQSQSQHRVNIKSIHDTATGITGRRDSYGRIREHMITKVLTHGGRFMKV